MKINEILKNKKVTLSLEVFPPKQQAKLDSVLQAMKELGASKEESVYVGDSEVDLATARAAGIPCITVLWGFREKEFLLEQGAERFALHPGEIPGLLGELPE